MELEIEGAGSRGAPGYSDHVELDVAREVIQTSVDEVLLALIRSTTMQFSEDNRIEEMPSRWT